MGLLEKVQLKALSRALHLARTSSVWAKSWNARNFKRRSPRAGVAGPEDSPKFPYICIVILE